MTLLHQARTDMTAIVESNTDFGRPVVVTAPDGTTANLRGLASDIGTTFDPDTGMPIVGRRASVSLTMSALLDAFGELPSAISSPLSKPWVVTYDDSEGGSHSFKILKAMPDRTVGLLACIVEGYDAG